MDLSQAVEQIDSIRLKTLDPNYIKNRPDILHPLGSYYKQLRAALQEDIMAASSEGELARI